MHLSNHCKIELPAWVADFVGSWQQPLSTTSQRMNLAIALSRENIQQQTGGPFAAVVVNEETSELVSVGINLVTTTGLSIAHAEMVALSLAQSLVGEWNLSHAGHLQLVTSCEPCAMCFGAVPWSGVKSLICGAQKRDAEAAGFDEGDKPDNWVRSLQRRGIVVQCGVLRSEAAAVLAHYSEDGGAIYNADHGHEKN
ncbi:MAG: nucleoside deaminase [Gammaproteobacteria bacterium]|nr:nucleoside deaminase [Gammaproteobacteria bacterium]